jgi:hypothetical protein
VGLEDVKEEEAEERDNRNIVPTTSNQKMSAEDVEQMKSKATDGS